MVLFRRYSSMHEGFRTRVICIIHSHAAFFIPWFVAEAHSYSERQQPVSFCRASRNTVSRERCRRFVPPADSDCRGMTGVESCERCITGRRIVSAMLGRMFEIRLTPDFAPAIASAG